MGNVVTQLPVRTENHSAPSSTTLTTAEISALALSLAHLGTGTQADTARQGLRRLFTNPESGLGELDVDDLIVATLTTLTAPLDPVSADRAAVVASAITNRLVVRLHYRDAKEAVSTREVEPVTCLVHRDHWYLVGRCRLRQAIRAFRFDRVLAIETTGISAPAHPAARFLPFQRRG